MHQPTLALVRRLLLFVAAAALLCAPVAPARAQAVAQRYQVTDLCRADAINSFGEVVGIMDTSRAPHLFIYRGGVSLRGVQSNKAVVHISAPR